MLIMLDKRFKYNKGIAITEEDLSYIKSLKKGYMGKKSLAGILSYIINNYKTYDESKGK